VAIWSDAAKTPLIGTRGSKRVDLNFFPPSSDVTEGFWRSYTDGAKIIANSLNWIAGGACAAFTDCVSCSGPDTCQWCLDTRSCTPEDFNCPNRVVDPDYCPAPVCRQYTKCSDCLTTHVVKYCSWCLDNTSCVVKNTTCRGQFNDIVYCSS